MEDLPGIRNDVVEKIKLLTQELHEEVISLFKLGNGDNGEIMFDRWIIRFRSFLEEKLIQEIPNYEKSLATGRKKLSLSSEYENFMRTRGSSLLNYLGILIDEVEKGFLDDQLINSSHFISESLDNILAKNGKAKIHRDQIVFVVYGRNLRAKEAVFEFLRSIDIHPLEFAEARRITGNPTPYIGEILEKAFSIAKAVIVLMTPDDAALLREQFRQKNDPSYEINLTPQARPNVIFEAGMSMGKNPKHTIIIELGKLRPFSDISGRHLLYLNDSLGARQEFIDRLQSAGCKVETKNRKWKSAGSFDAAVKESISTSSGYKPNDVSKTKKYRSNLFDVFLCYHPDDRSAVEEVGMALKQRGISPWLDVWEIRPGHSWHRALEDQIQNISCAAVFVGESGIGPWETPEIELLIREFTLKNSPVIPILFANALKQPSLPIYLKGVSWVDFRKGDPNPMEQLIWGITGNKQGKSK